MSIRATNWAWVVPIKADPITKLVFLALADFANEEGECTPGYEILAERCEISPSGVRLAIRRLELTHHVQILPDHQPRRYRLKIGKPPA